MTSTEKVRKWRAKNPEKYKEQSKRYYEKHKEKIKQRASTHNRKKRTGVSHEDFVRMLIQQEGRCAICLKLFSSFGDPRKALSPRADHNHKTGKPRQLLCYRCNIALGLVDEDILILSRMIDYLNRHSK